MADKSKIEWTDATWNPLVAYRGDKRGWHCEKISPACDHCYAASMNKRSDGLVGIGTGLNYAPDSRAKLRFEIHEETLIAPLRWRRPRRIFVCSMTDLFGDWHDVEQIAQTFAVIALAHWHTFQVLTKRPERMLQLLLRVDFWDLVEAMMTMILDGEVNSLERRRNDLRATAPETSPDLPLPNVWLGVTAENQARADERIPLLLKTPAAVRFLSAEPLLGPIDLTSISWLGLDHRVDVLRRGYWNEEGYRGLGPSAKLGAPRGGFTNHSDMAGLDWVITGGESGPGARPSHPDWFRSLRDQCVAAGVPFFFKQWGAWVPRGPESLGYRVLESGATMRLTDAGCDGSLLGADGGNDVWMQHTTKAIAGRKLDGVEWSQFPEVRRG